MEWRIRVRCYRATLVPYYREVCTSLMATSIQTQSKYITSYAPWRMTTISCLGWKCAHRDKIVGQSACISFNVYFLIDHISFPLCENNNLGRADTCRVVCFLLCVLFNHIIYKNIYQRVTTLLPLVSCCNLHRDQDRRFRFRLTTHQMKVLNFLTEYLWKKID